MGSPHHEDGPTSSGSSQHEDAMGSQQPEVGPTSSGSSQHEDAMASPQHEDGLASSGYPTRICRRIRLFQAIRAYWTGHHV
jgi:hypothetical protein